MDVAGYVALTRQSGLDTELQVVANNIANLSTTGFQREGVIFAEMVQILPTEGGSVAMAAARARFADDLQGALVPTGGDLDFAVEGEGFFTVMSPGGERLTRAGAFTRDGTGQVTTMDGWPLLDEGGGTILIPIDAESIVLGPDGSLSVDGQAVVKLGLVKPADPTQVSREAGTLYRVDGEVDPVDPADGWFLQGFVEQSNVNAVSEMARMVSVQRAYEYGQKLMDREDQRIAETVKVLGSQS